MGGGLELMAKFAGLAKTAFEAVGLAKKLTTEKRAAASKHAKAISVALLDMASFERDAGPPLAWAKSRNTPGIW